MLPDLSPPFRAQNSHLDARPRHNEGSTDGALGEQGSGHRYTLDREIFATDKTLECSCGCMSFLGCRDRDTSNTWMHEPICSNLTGMQHIEARAC